MLISKAHRLHSFLDFNRKYMTFGCFISIELDSKGFELNDCRLKNEYQKQKSADYLPPKFL